jgi:adenylosuccinate lyase
MDRQAAYVVVQRNAMKMYELGVPFKEALLADTELLKLMSREEIAASFTTDYHLRNMDVIFKRVFGE